MPLNSVQTNTGAASALRVLNGAARELATTQRRVATGRRVESVRDSGAAWAVAQSQRGELRALGAIVTSLRRTESIVDVAIASGAAIVDLLTRMKEKALGAAEEGLSADSRAALDREFQALRDQITRVVEAADFDGVNLIDQSAEGYDVIAGLGSETKTVPPTIRTFKNGKAPKVIPGGVQTIRSTLTVTAEFMHLNGPEVTVSSTAALTDATASKTILDQLNASLSNIGQSMSRLGATANQIQRQQTFLVKVQDGLTKGVGDLVDADIGRETARLRALETRQALGLQSLSIANGAPRVLLGLFRD
jgi:flagellin